MIRLVYVSTAREQVSPVTLADILRTSRLNNVINDVSGLLIVGGRRFLQALEGPRDPVLATYARMQRDPRHSACVQLVSETVINR